MSIEKYFSGRNRLKCFYHGLAGLKNDLAVSAVDHHIASVRLSGNAAGIVRHLKLTILHVVQMPDPLYNDKVVTKLINNIMLDGKRGVAQKIVYGAFARVEEKAGKPALEVFEEAMNNIMPVLEVKARRIGGATYQVPIEVRADRRQALGLRWLTMFSRKRGEKTMEERLANEILDASNNTGASVKRKEDVHKMAEANKAFSHYRF